MSVEPPIDAVVCWVDGSDPQWLARRRPFLGEAAHRSAADPGRFEQSDEVEACVRSILRFAPFIRRIHVVTDRQVPRFLHALRGDEPASAAKVRVVDHAHVFRGLEHAPPTFNSISIESVLHRIEGLSERYVYFNDDMFLARPIVPGELFDGDALVVHGRWRRFRERRPAWVVGRLLAPRRGEAPGYGLSQQRAARIAGFRHRYREVGHTPHPQLRSLPEAYHAAHPGVLGEQVAHRFRSAVQYSAVGLAYHLAIRDGRARLDGRDELLYVKADRIGRRRLDRALSRLRAGRYRFGCIQGLEAAPPEWRNAILAVLAEITGATFDASRGVAGRQAFVAPGAGTQ